MNGDAPVASVTGDEESDGNSDNVTDVQRRGSNNNSSSSQRARHFPSSIGGQRYYLGAASARCRRRDGMPAVGLDTPDIPEPSFASALLEAAPHAMWVTIETKEGATAHCVPFARGRLSWGSICPPLVSSIHRLLSLRSTGQVSVVRFRRQLCCHKKASRGGPAAQRDVSRMQRREER